MNLQAQLKALAIAFVTALAFSVFASPGALAGSEIVAQGTFTGASKHVTKGGATVLKTDSGHVLVLEGDFSLDSAPDPTIGFGKNGKFDKKTDFTKLSSKAGLQVYALPASINIAAYNEVYIWCRKFSVPLGIAKFK